MTGATSVRTYDVVVVGGGGAGLAAAIEARSLGRSVVLLEKNSKLGGSTARSVGSFSASNTPLQLRLGILDSPDDHFEDMGLFCARRNLPDNTALRRVLVDNVTDTFRWLSSMGVAFIGPTLEPPHRRPRMHNVLPTSGAYVYHLARRARRMGVHIEAETAVSDLVRLDDRVVGVRAACGEAMVEFRARGGVVLATGDFSGDREMRTHYIGPEVSLAKPANPTNTGDGHRMVLALGGRLINSHVHLGGARFDPPPPRFLASLPPIALVTKPMIWALDLLPAGLLRPFVMSFLTAVLRASANMLKEGGLMINREGRRFTDELGDPNLDIPQQPEGMAYFLLDGELREKFSHPPHYVSTAPGIAYAYLPDYRRSRKDVYHEARDLAGLERRLGMTPGSLQRTIVEYNASAAAGPSPRRPFGAGPYVALGPVRYYITYADSGVAVDERHRVLGQGDRAIPGLYAAGFIGMGGMLLEGLGHHIGWAFTSGRRAGRHAALAAVSGG
ncbi:FAD-dependent oxidoreductase [Reyranella sp.]|uniref:FAD-dependent oxidoreductase n=1 Tax=Reyranella sp. TaxID=1929291 RepID=UPI003785226F